VSTGAASPRTVLDYLRLATDWLGEKGVDGARLDCELLLAEVMGAERIALYTNFDKPLGDAEVTAFRELLRRRAAREPVAYILGRREFWSLDFRVDRRVLIPRPETELLVERTGALLAGRDAARVADIGTGSGALAVAIAVEVPAATVVATDTSGAALELAPANAVAHQVDGRVRFRHGDLFEALAGEEPFDVIVSNPPYITAAEYETLAPEIRNWEPPSALVAGADGMDVLERLVADAPAHLSADGVLLLEIGSQAEAVRRCMEEAGWRDVRVLADLAGLDRVVEGRRPQEVA
jgi:release factor glutamine methyltransferase